MKKIDPSGLFTTTNPRLWLTLTVSLILICLTGGLGLNCLAQEVSRDTAHLDSLAPVWNAASPASPGEQAALREGGPEDLAAVVEARRALIREAETALSLPAPPRNQALTAEMRRDLDELGSLWVAAGEALTSDTDEGRLAVARAIRFGEGIGREWTEQRARIYNEPLPPPTTDPARPF